MSSTVTKSKTNASASKSKAKSENGKKKTQKNGKVAGKVAVVAEVKKQKMPQLNVEHDWRQEIEHDDDDHEDLDIDGGILHPDQVEIEMDSSTEIVFSISSINDLLTEFFDHQDTSEFIDNIEGLIKTSEVASIKRILNVSLDRNDPERELVSALLLAMKEANVINNDHVYEGFQSLIVEANDLVKDVPDSASILSKFIARAIGDGLLTPSFLDSLPKKAKLGKEICEITQSHLKCGNGRLHGIWGVNGNKPVKVLTNQMHLTIQEYLSSRDSVEAARLLHELYVPHFHHEFVYIAILSSLEKYQNWESIMVLFKSLQETQIVTNTQFREGYQRVLDDINSLRLDFPNIFSDFSRILEMSCEKGIISQEVVDEMPNIAKKRRASSNSHT